MQLLAWFLSLQKEFFQNSQKQKLLHHHPLLTAIKPTNLMVLAKPQLISMNWRSKKRKFSFSRIQRSLHLGYRWLKRRRQKSHEVCMHHITLLGEHISHLEEEMGNKKNRKLQTRHYIQNGGSLSVAEAKRHEGEQQRELERDAQPRLHRPPKCSDCGVFGHKRNQCSRR